MTANCVIGKPCGKSCISAVETCHKDGRSSRRNCVIGKPCGRSCISRVETCHKDSTDRVINKTGSCSCSCHTSSDSHSSSSCGRTIPPPQQNPAFWQNRAIPSVVPSAPPIPGPCRPIPTVQVNPMPPRCFPMPRPTVPVDPIPPRCFSIPRPTVPVDPMPTPCVSAPIPPVEVCRPNVVQVNNTGDQNGGRGGDCVSVCSTPSIIPVAPPSACGRGRVDPDGECPYVTPDSSVCGNSADPGSLCGNSANTGLNDLDTTSTGEHAVPGEVYSDGLLGILQSLFPPLKRF